MRKADDLLISLDQITCGYGNEVVLDRVDFSIERAQFTGVVGPSGSGKTTLLRVVTGTVSPAAGSVWQSNGLRLAYVPQVETVNWNFPVTVGECVLMARTTRRGTTSEGSTRGSYGRWAPWPSRDERRLADEMLARLGIGGLADRHIRELSGGQQQRMFIARALLGEPQLLLMDEPTSGVDVKTRHEIVHLLGELNSEGLAIVVTTHDLNGMAAHLPHLVCLNREVIAAGTPGEVLTPAVLERTYGAPMEVLEHGGMPVVVDHYGRDASSVRAIGNSGKSS
ncbi:MAG: metal ABC transporter ATP-binding protein [Acidimicrobiales bacterium]